MSGWGYRVCAACGQNLRSSEYTQNQWRKGVGDSRCRVCVQENLNGGEESAQETTCRANFSNKASVELDNIIGEGSFRLVALGKYIGGPRNGQKCAFKWFKSDDFDFDDFVKQDMRAINVATKIIHQWNQAQFIQKAIRLNSPQKWKILQPSTSDYGVPRPTEFLVEPYIDNFVKFNSNTGWTDGSSDPWSLVMQALSHYSYHISSGMFLLCDLQGGTYRDGAILTDPVIQSRRQEFGPTDLGPEGISSFFSHHSCNKFCRSDWTQPRDTRAYHYATKASTYVPPQEYYDDEYD